MHRAARQHPETAVSHKPLHILARPSRNRAPLRPVIVLEKPVIAEELEEGKGRIVQHLIG